MIIDNLTCTLSKVITDMGYIFWGIELENRGLKSSVIRIFIDLEDGISLEDCQKVSRQIASVLDVEDIIEEHYVLEVSSPGIDRRIFNIHQAKSLINFEVKVKLNELISNRKKFIGFIKDVDISNEKILFLVDNEEINIDFNLIKKIKVNPKW